MVCFQEADELDMDVGVWRIEGVEAKHVDDTIPAVDGLQIIGEQSQVTGGDKGEYFVLLFAENRAVGADEDFAWTRDIALHAHKHRVVIRGFDVEFRGGEAAVVQGEAMEAI